MAEAHSAPPRLGTAARSDAGGPLLQGQGCVCSLRCRGAAQLRVAAVVLLAGAACQAFGNPLGILLYSGLAAWPGLRLAVRGRIEATLLSRGRRR